MVYLGFSVCFISFLLIAQTAPPELIPVDAGVEDRGALSSSFSVQLHDLRVDTSFEKLYKIAGSEGVYVRKSGGLTAVFHNSEYVRTHFGEMPVVPAGTVYCIGEIPAHLFLQLTELQGEQDIPASMVQPERVVTKKKSSFKPTPISTHTFAFIENEAYRRQRLTAFVLEMVLLAP